MIHTNRRNVLGAFSLLVSAMALVACGGGDDPAPGASSSGGSSGVTIAPTSTSANSASGTISGNSFIDSTGGTTYSTPTVSFASAAVTASGTVSLGGSPTYGGMLIGSTLSATTFNANSYTTLKIQLKSSTDTSIRVRLQPGTTDNTGCLPSNAVTVTSTLTEYTIPLDSTNFTQAFVCTYAVGSDFTSIKGAMGQVEVINEALTNGTHDVTVGTIKFE